MRTETDRRKINGEWVKALRKQLGLTQPEFAKRLDVSVPSIARWEADLFRPTKLAANALLLLATSIPEVKAPQSSKKHK
jgi:DNA-binding transcriptional regulator YiaG